MNLYEHQLTFNPAMRLIFVQHSEKSRGLCGNYFMTVPKKMIREFFFKYITRKKAENVDFLRNVYYNHRYP